jgi:hypothetical protein
MSGSAAIIGNTASGNGGIDGGGGVYVYNNAASFSMEGGTIGGNKATGTYGYGGGVYVFSDSNSTFIMKGGTVYGSSGANPNTATTGASLYKDTNGKAYWGNGVTWSGGTASPANNPAPDATTFIVGNDSTAWNTNDTLTATP